MFFKRGSTLRVLGIFVFTMVCVPALTACQPPERASQNRSASGLMTDPASARVESIEQIAQKALSECDKVASHPSDPGRFAAGVPDDQMAPGLAVQICEDAVRLNSNNARMEFQLGRAYWSAARQSEALSQFAAAADKGYAPAMAYIGDAYLNGDGLPPGVQPNSTIALDWHQKAASGGFRESADAVTEIQGIIRKNTFDRSLFQRPDFMQRLYDGSGLDPTLPQAHAYYMMGVAAMLDSQETIFLDQSCKPLISKLGNDVLGFVPAAGTLMQVFKTNNNGEVNWGTIAAGVLASMFTDATKQYWYDMGKRDATVLFDPETYGCRTEVTQNVVRSIMVTAKGRN
jgi:hypothetical protein